MAEPLTITGSIGVVTGKFNLAELYGKIGYNKELISWGKYAELFADNRTFSKEVRGRTGLLGPCVLVGGYVGYGSRAAGP